METLVIGIVCIATVISNIVCLVIGVRIGQQVSRGEEVKLPTVNPVEAVREYREKQEEKWEHQRLDTILRNIESYDGTALGQEDVPGR